MLSRSLLRLLISAQQEIINQGNNLYVSGLNVKTTEEDLTRKFSKCGKVIEASLVRDRDSNPRGFGFVRMESIEQAEAAIVELNGEDLNGYPLRVERVRICTTYKACACDNDNRTDLRAVIQAKRSCPRDPTPGRYLGNDRSGMLLPPPSRIPRSAERLIPLLLQVMDASDMAAMAIDMAEATVAAAAAAVAAVDTAIVMAIDMAIDTTTATATATMTATAIDMTTATATDTTTATAATAEVRRTTTRALNTLARRVTSPTIVVRLLPTDARARAAAKSPDLAILEKSPHRQRHRQQ